MKTILLPTDFSDNSWNAIEYALNFYKEVTCRFFLLHVNRISNVVTNDYPYVPSQEIVENIYIKPSKKQLTEMLKKISKCFPNNKRHKFYTLTDYDFFIEAIRKHVTEKKVDLIVMGTKGATGLAKYIVGTNTGDIITKVKCTTLVVPENAKFKAIKEIAFPTGFSQSNHLQLLEPISEILDQYKASSLRIVHIRKKEAVLNSDQEKNKEFLEDFFHEYEYSFHFLTNKKVEDAIQCFVESRDIDMIAMVAKNLNYFQQILFHTKVQEISYHTDLPFLVLHEQV
jgi:nucleotide-binding universal stress UspA family protein